MSGGLLRLGSAGCQPATFGSLPNARGTVHLAFAMRVRGKLPRTTGEWQVLPRRENTQ